MGMDKIRDAIISKVEAEAGDIAVEAKEKGQEEIEKAKRQRELRFDEERRRLLGEAEEEAARILAQASIQARQQLSSAKADAIARAVHEARQELSGSSSDQAALLRLIREAAAGVSADKVRIFVSPRDVGTVRRFLETDEELSRTIVEIRESNCLGGAIAEDIEGKFRIDNTYETRLEMLLPRLLPEINEKLFKSP